MAQDCEVKHEICEIGSEVFLFCFVFCLFVCLFFQTHSVLQPTLTSTQLEIITSFLLSLLFMERFWLL